MNIFRFFRVLALAPLFLFLVSAHAQSVPAYTSGSVFDFGDLLSTNQEQSLERQIAAYEAQTDSQIGIITTDGRTSLDAWLSALDDKGYAPDGLRLVVDGPGRALSLQHNARWARAGVWTDGTSKTVSERVLYPAFAEGQYADGLADFIDEVARRVPDSIAKTTEKADQREQTAQVAQGTMWRVALIIIAVLLAIYAASVAVTRWRFRQRKDVVLRFYNEQLPLFETDLEHLPQGQNTLTSELTTEYAALLTDTRTRIEHWLEQSEQTNAEAEQLADMTEGLENELTAFVNDSDAAIAHLGELTRKRDALLQTLTRLTQRDL